MVNVPKNVVDVQKHVMTIVDKKGVVNGKKGQYSRDPKTWFQHGKCPQKCGFIIVHVHTTWYNHGKCPQM